MICSFIKLDKKKVYYLFLSPPNNFTITSAPEIWVKITLVKTMSGTDKNMPKIPQRKPQNNKPVITTIVFNEVC